MDQHEIVVEIKRLTRELQQLFDFHKLVELYKVVEQLKIPAENKRHVLSDRNWWEQLRAKDYRYSMPFVVPTQYSGTNTHVIIAPVGSRGCSWWAEREEFSALYKILREEFTELEIAEEMEGFFEATVLPIELRDRLSKMGFVFDPTLDEYKEDFLEMFEGC